MEYWSQGISDFGLKELQSDQIHSKNPQSTIPNPQSYRSNPPELSIDETPTTDYFLLGYSSA